MPCVTTQSACRAASASTTTYVGRRAGSCARRAGAAGSLDAQLELPNARQVLVELHLDRVKQMLDLSVLAFRCDLTRVTTFGYEHTVTEQAHPWVGVKDGYHIGVTRNQPGAPYVAVNTWIISQLAYLLDRLKATADGSGTLLDNTIVYFASELGEGSAHDPRNIPVIVAGAAPGASGPDACWTVPGRATRTSSSRSCKRWTSTSRASAMV